VVVEVLRNEIVDGIFRAVWGRGFVEELAIPSDEFERDTELRTVRVRGVGVVDVRDVHTEVDVAVGAVKSP